MIYYLHKRGHKKCVHQKMQQMSSCVQCDTDRANGYKYYEYKAINGKATVKRNERKRTRDKLTERHSLRIFFLA